MRLFGKSKPVGPDPNLARLARNLDEAEIRHLEVLRREVGNVIMAADPDQMVRSFEKAWTWERETSKNPERLRADELALVAKLKSFEDFDIINHRHFVPYADVLDMTSIADVVERYMEIGRMLVFMKNRSEFESVRSRPVHDEKEHKTMLDVVARERGKRFKVRIEEALRRCHAYRHGIDTAKGDPFAGLHETYSDAEVEVFQIPYGASPENETGIHFKKTDEYGVYSFFMPDGGKRIDSYYRTDAQFEIRDYVAR